MPCGVLKSRKETKLGHIRKNEINTDKKAKERTVKKKLHDIPVGDQFSMNI